MIKYVHKLHQVIFTWIKYDTHWNWRKEFGFIVIHSIAIDFKYCNICQKSFLLCTWRSWYFSRNLRLHSNNNTPFVHPNTKSAQFSIMLAMDFFSRRLSKKVNAELLQVFTFPARSRAHYNNNCCREIYRCYRATKNSHRLLTSLARSQISVWVQTNRIAQVTIFFSEPGTELWHSTVTSRKTDKKYWQFLYISLVIFSTGYSWKRHNGIWSPGY